MGPGSARGSTLAGVLRPRGASAGPRRAAWLRRVARDAARPRPPPHLGPAAKRGRSPGAWREHAGRGRRGTRRRAPQWRDRGRGPPVSLPQTGRPPGRQAGTGPCEAPRPMDDHALAASPERPPPANQPAATPAPSACWADTVLALAAPLPGDSSTSTTASLASRVPCSPAVAPPWPPRPPRAVSPPRRAKAATDVTLTDMLCVMLSVKVGGMGEGRRGVGGKGRPVKAARADRPPFLQPPPPMPPTPTCACCGRHKRPQQSEGAGQALSQLPADPPVDRLPPSARPPPPPRAPLKAVDRVNRYQ